MTSDPYDAFVRQALLDPIRSALIIDDDYPTYDDILAITHSEDLKRKEWRAAPQRARNLIRQFRDREVPLLVDIHDGRNVSIDGAGEVAGHLHQSDLLVLDYELDRDEKEDGTIAIDILRRLAANTHFNLVIIYSSMQLERVFQEVRVGLLTESRELRTHDEGIDTQVHERLERAEEVWMGAERDLLDSVGKEVYTGHGSK